MKSKTKAYLVIEALRDALNKDRTRIDAPNLKAVAYTYETSSGDPCAVLYHGRRKKPDLHIRYDSNLKREEGIQKHFSRYQDREKCKRELAVSDVLCCTWGYEQTNVDFYEVVRLIGEYSVAIRKIGCDSTPTEWLQGRKIPIPGLFIGDEMIRRVCPEDGTRVVIQNYNSATLEKPTITDDGEKVYESFEYSGYH